MQVVEAHLRQIRRWNPQLHAIVSLREVEALHEAGAADRMQKDGQKLGPLHGVPITLKDALRVRGVRSTFGGLPPYLRHLPQSDCQLAERLRQAGAIILGRTNLPLMALDWQCRGPFFKEGKNPWDPSRTPGGSSGGAAAALAAGFTPLELGSDLGGSIRYPAHCCGILGLRTTDGLLPIDDIGPEAMSAGFHGLLSLGPMARSIPDLALMLDVLMGSDKPAAESTLPVTPPLRIAVSARWGGAEPNSATAALIDKLVAGLRADGHVVDREVAPEVDPEEAWRVWGTLAGYNLWSATPPLLKTGAARWLFSAYMLHYKLGDGPATKWFKQGMAASRDESAAALAQRKKMLAVVDAFFKRYALWIVPVCMGEAIRRQRRGTAIEAEGKTFPYSFYLGAYTIPTTVFGTPVLTAPIGLGSTGLPIGVQIHGPRFADRLLLETASRFLSQYLTVHIPPLMATER